MFISKIVSHISLFFTSSPSLSPAPWPSSWPPWSRVRTSLACSRQIDRNLSETRNYIHSISPEVPRTLVCFSTDFAGALNLATDGELFKLSSFTCNTTKVERHSTQQRYKHLKERFWNTTSAHCNTTKLLTHWNTTKLKYMARQPMYTNCKPTKAWRHIVSM